VILLGKPLCARAFCVPRLSVRVEFRDWHREKRREPFQVLRIRGAASAFPLRDLRWLTQPYILGNLLLRKAFCLS
jgi:hypothetical protein